MAPTALILPALSSLEACADWSLTVEPYIPYLKQLPSHFVESITGHGFKAFYLSMNPLVSAFALSLLLAPIFLVVSEVNKNYSQVDRCWSLLPTVYNAHYMIWAHMQGLPTHKLDYIFVFSCIWSTRLTYNYWRKGGYNVGSEDYRWLIVKSKIPGPIWFLFNVVFISLIQSVLLFSVTTPAYVLLLASRLSPTTLTTSDRVFANALIALVVLSFLGDQQQWNYQNAKKSYQKSAKVSGKYTQEDLDRGFCTSGLWSYSRHPNFAAEQSCWVGLYLWGCYTTGTLYNWTGVGAISYLLLFWGSTLLTESISAGKYPEYKLYQKHVPKFVPGPLAIMSGPVDMNAMSRSGGKKQH